MNPFTMVVAIVAMAMMTSIISKWLDYKKNNASPALKAENEELRRALGEMRERLQVLERITVDKENSLARQIDELKDR
ncbi:hypothetical protein [Sphingomicrobium flavum]|uniref:hypothetical protein n=1 Tax=Sphingomicrobium flavum TaxID=1229164 RepID=UPI0021ADEDC8|nr:hypothetical protein [Sphingomicrobium flavum]